MLCKDCKGRGKSHNLSKWSGPYKIVEVHCPQVVVLEEPNSQDLKKVEQIINLKHGFFHILVLPAHQPLIWNHCYQVLPFGKSASS